MTNLHTDRVRFNWGFHDAAFDQQRNKAARTQGDHLFALPAKDRAYREGYVAGYAEPSECSTMAWKARQAAAKAARAERQRIRNMRP